MTWVAGRPAVFLGSGEAQWKSLLRECGFRSSHPVVRFSVATWTRGGNYFDLENLVTPVLVALKLTPDTLWATVQCSESEGVLLDEGQPPEPPAEIAFSTYIATPPRHSHRGLPPLPELEGIGPLGADSPLGLQLIFDDPAERFGPYGFDGSVKPIVDALGPLLGWRRAIAGGPADDRIRDLRVRRGAQPGKTGVTIRLWYLATTGSPP